MKKPTCASKQDGLVLATIQYEKEQIFFGQFQTKMFTVSSMWSLRDNELGRWCDWSSVSLLSKLGTNQRNNGRS